MFRKLGKTTNEINYTRTEYVRYANKYNKYKTEDEKLNTWHETMKQEIYSCAYTANLNSIWKVNSAKLHFYLLTHKL